MRGFSLLLVVLCLTFVARAQSGGSVRMSGGVSRTVALTIQQEAEVPESDVRVNVSRNADQSLTVTITGATRGLKELRIPVQIRSNSSYSLSAAAEASGANLSSLLVVGARTTGPLAAPEAAESVSVSAAFDGRNGADSVPPVGGSNRPNLSSPSELLSGPRVSLAGTLQTPQNALEVTLSITIEPRGASPSWRFELRLWATPAAP